MSEDGSRSDETVAGPDAKEGVYEPPEMEVIEGDDRAAAAAWVTGFPNETQ